jgi:hypothetical protein
LKSALQAYQAAEHEERQRLIAELTARKVPFEQAELEQKGLVELRKLAVLAGTRSGSYAARGGPRDVRLEAAEQPRFMKPVPYWARPNTEKKEEK